MISRTAMRAAAAVVCSAVLLSACVSSSSGRKRATPSPSPSPSEVALGTPVSTNAGNTVTVHAFERLDAKASSARSAVVAADIEACASQSSATAVTRSLFIVETADKKTWPSVKDVKTPALSASLIPPNQCARGWVTFDIPKKSAPQFVVLNSSTVAKWRVS